MKKILIIGIVILLIGAGYFYLLPRTEGEPIPDPVSVDFRWEP